MKNIKIKSLHLINFRGEKDRTTNFNADITTISGCNGSGKSRHFDAFIWLLSGKDSQDRKDFEIKTRVNGEELHKVECSVTAVLVIDEQEITLKRAFIEDWVKPRGQVEQVFKGNHTECWWNETPVSVSEYESRINDIINSEVFKMITNPKYFVNMQWKLKREQLFQIAGTVTDEELAQDNKDFKLLLDRLSGKSITDFRKEVAAKKKRLNEELKQIQPRIDQTQKLKPESEDFEALEKEIAHIDNEIAAIDKTMSDTDAMEQRVFADEQEKRKKINELKSQQLDLVYNANIEAQKKANELNLCRKELENKLKNTKREITSNKSILLTIENSTKVLQEEIKSHKEEQDKLREEWFAENSKEYQGETTCSQCGQELPQSIIDKAQEIFNNTKAKRLEEINSQGKLLTEKILIAGNKIEDNEVNIVKYNGIICQNQNEIDKLNKELSTTKEVVAETVIKENIPQWVDMQKEIEKIESTIEKRDNIGAEDTAKKMLQQQKADCNVRRNGLVERLSKRETIKRCDDEVASLEEQGKALSQQIADIEGQEYVAAQFTKKKIEECEERINHKFQIVKFRLFDYTIDGNPIETCIPMIDGVIYDSANTASQINGGLDIINTLSEFYGINAPIFIDNRESVNKIIETQSQIINLVVTEDKELVIK